MTTPLHRAAQSGSIAVVKLLLERNADVCTQDADGRTPLHKVRYDAEGLLSFSQKCGLMILA